MSDKSKAIEETMKELGIPANLNGYHYIVCGVKLILEKKHLIFSTMKLYEEVAKRFNKTRAQVERSIRVAIETGWSRGNVDFINKLFGYSVDADAGRPINSAFLTTVAEYVRRIGE